MTRGSNQLAAWGISGALHILLLVLTFPPGSSVDGRGIRQYEVGWVEIYETGGKPDAAPVERKSEGVGANLRPEPLSRPGPGKKQAANPDKPAGPQENASEPPKKENPAKESGISDKKGSNESRSGGSISLGSGEQFVIARPVYYPKNAQNEGITGKVKVALILSTDGSVRASILESSGDDRLDRYSIRAVTEAWKYARPTTSVRILVSLVFLGDRAEVIFEGTEAWDGEGT